MCRQIPRHYNKFFGLLIFVLLSGCSISFTGFNFSRAKSAQEKRDYVSALKYYRQVITRAPETTMALQAARESASISLFETKNFKEATEYYSHIVKYAPTDKERREAQKSIAKIYIEKLADYAKAKEELNKLLLLQNSNEDAVDYRFDLARVEFYLNNFLEAQTETEQALKTVENIDKKYELLMFLGNIYFNTKKTDQAISTYETIVREYPERAKKENVAMNIVVCYEDAESFDKAIERLEGMRTNYSDVEFIDLKIKRLRARKANQPGSKGLRK